ncbi:MerR family transcriptional regulator [Thalassiella azotivora]
MASPSDGRDDTGTPVEPTLKVAAVARRLGVAPATLRTWARRYGLGPPAHTAGAHRQYTPEDLARLLEMRRLTVQGVAPGEAARIARDLDVDPAEAAELAGLSGPGPGAVRGRVRLVEDGAGPGVPSQGRAGGRPVGRDAQDDHGRGDPASGHEDGAGPAGRPVGLRSVGSSTGAGSGPPARGRPAAAPAPLDDVLDRLDPAVRDLVQAAAGLDAVRLRSRLRDVVESRGVVPLWDELAVPALAALGAHWAATGQGTEIEHALSQGVLEVLHAVTVTADEPLSGTALLACAEDDHHALPVQALAAALAERRVAVQVLGARLPHDALVAAVTRLGPKIVVLHASQPVPERQRARLSEVEDRTRLLLGGPSWDDVEVPDGAVRATSLTAAVDQVRLAVRH